MERHGFNRLIAPFRRKLKAMITRGLVRLVDPDTLMQTLQVELLGGEVLDGVEHFEGYGYTAHAPEDGREVLVLAAGASRDHSLAVSVANRKFRLRGLKAGEVALYTDEGDVIHFKRDQEILIDSRRQVTVHGATKVQINTTDAEVNCDGDATVTAGGKTVVNASVIELNGTDGDVVTTKHTCAYTGGPHPVGSAKVKAGG